MTLSLTDLNAYAAAGYNRVPVSRELLADYETPLSTYRKLASEPYTFLFESVQGGEKWGRYSIIGLSGQQILTVRNHEVEIKLGDKVLSKKTVDDPLQAIEDFHSQFKSPEVAGLPRFTGGLVGYFGFDTVHYIEKTFKPNTKVDPVGAPDIQLMVTEELVVFDNLSGRLFLIVHIDPNHNEQLQTAYQRLDELEQKLSLPSVARSFLTAKKSITEADFVSSFPKEPFKAAVDVCKQYITDGDVFQVVISQHLSTDFDADPLDLYRALRTLNPSPYMYYLDMGDFHIAGSSPEILVRLEDDEVTVRPIAGTRKRGKTEAEDIALEQDLLSDPKELAEHLMLVDLGRNDAGRIAKVGTVKLTERDLIERYSHVMHIVSNVTADLDKEKHGLMDVLRATFPAGTVSGAPKIRAMEIIEELEPVKRGVYSGAIGYLGWNGNLDTAIAIRTAVIHNKKLHIQAGAGVVADSQPELEWQETINKARAVFKAAELAASGMDLQTLKN